MLLCLKRKLFQKILLLLILTACTVVAYTQTNVLGGWYFVNLNYHINQKIFVYSEVQTRSQHVLDDFYYQELKAGLGYNFSHNKTVFLGFGNYNAFTYPGNYKKPIVTNENRIWEQFIITNNVSRIYMEHRLRIEQRWVNGDYLNRFRYRLALSIPINHIKMEDRTLFPALFDEVFFTDKEPVFIRNRFFGGAGYRFSKSVTIQAGFLRQSDFSSGGKSSGKNFILTSVSFNAGNNHKKIQPSSAD